MVSVVLLNIMLLALKLQVPSSEYGRCIALVDKLVERMPIFEFYGHPPFLI